MAKPATLQIKLLSTADTGFYYVTKKNPRTKPEKLELKKYDPKVTLFAKIFGFGQLVFGSFYSQSFFFNVSSMGTTEIFLIQMIKI